MANTPPVSGPGQFSQRTDRAPGQPVRVPTGMPYGKAKQLEQAQQAVPVPAEPGGAAPPGPVGPPGPPQGGPQTPVSPMPDNILQLVSHPTQRPNEPVNTPLQGQPQPVDTRQVLMQVENLIHSTPVVPASLMRLYQNLRNEVMNGP